MNVFSADEFQTHDEENITSKPGLILGHAAYFQNIIQKRAREAPPVSRGLISEILTERLLSIPREQRKERIGGVAAESRLGAASDELRTKPCSSRVRPSEDGRNKKPWLK